MKEEEKDWEKSTGMEARYGGQVKGVDGGRLAGGGTWGSAVFPHRGAEVLRRNLNGEWVLKKGEEAEGAGAGRWVGVG